MIHFKEVPIFVNILPDQLQKILQFVQKCYDNRLNSSLSIIKEAEFYLNNLNEFIINEQTNISTKDKDDAIILYQYFSELITLLHKEYDIQDRSIIAFLVYYLKTPLLLLDDPLLKDTSLLIKGLDPNFISSFIILSPEERLEFIYSLHELEISFNDWFNKDKDCPILDFNLIEYCDKFSSTLIKTYIEEKENKKKHKCNEYVEKEICSDFSRYYHLDNNKDKTFENIFNLLFSKYNYDKESSELIANDLIHTMESGKNNPYINIRCNQMKLLQSIYSEEKYVELSDLIEDSTLNVIHDCILMQKAIKDNPFDYETTTKQLKRLKKNQKKYEKNTIQGIDNILDLDIINYASSLQQYYNLYKNDIQKCIKIYTSIFSSSKSYDSTEIITILEEKTKHLNINIQALQFFQLFYKCFSGDLSYLPKNNRSNDIYSEHLSDLDSSLTHKIEDNSLFQIDTHYNIHKVQPYFSNIHYEIKKEYPDYDEIKDQLVKLDFEPLSIEKSITLLEVGKISSFISLLHEHIAGLKYKGKHSKNPFQNQSQILDNKSNKDNESLWILIKPLLNIPSHHKFYIKHVDGRKEHSHPYFGKTIKECSKYSHYYTPTNIFWSNSSLLHTNNNTEENLIIGTYDPSNPYETIQDLTEEDYNKVKAISKKNETKQNQHKNKLINSCITLIQIQQCKTIFTNTLRLFYKKNNSKRNPNKDAYYFINSLQTMLNYTHQSLCYTLGIFLKKLLIFDILLNTLHSYTLSFQKLWLNTEHNSYPKLLNMNLIQCFPELFLTSDIKLASDSFNYLVDKRESEYLNFISSSFLDDDLNNVSKHIVDNVDDIEKLFKEDYYYSVNQNGSILCLSKDHIYKTIRGEIKIDGIHNSTDLLKNFIPFNSKDSLSYLAFIQCKVDSIFKKNKIECLQLALRILSYSKGFIRFSKLNMNDKNYISKVLTSIQDPIYKDIAIHTLISIAIEYYKINLIEIIRSYFNNFSNEINNCKQTLSNHILKNDIDHCYTLYSNLFTQIESALQITLNDYSKEKIIYYMNNILTLELNNKNTNNINQHLCSICNEYNKNYLQTITIHKEGNILLDKVENFCSVECLDVHLASAPTPNEDEMKQLELRSLIRDCLKTTFFNLNTLRSISIHLIIQRINLYIKKSFSIKGEFPLLQLNQLKKEEQNDINNYINSILTQLNPYSNSFSSLLKQCLLFKDDNDTFMFTSIFQLPIFLQDHSYKTSSINIVNYNPHIDTYRKFLTKSIEHFKPNIHVSNLSLPETNTIIYSTLFENPHFLEMFFSVVDEITNHTQENIDVEVEEENYSCSDINLKVVKKWLHTFTFNNTTSFDTIISAFEEKFKYNLPSKEDLIKYENIKNASYTLYSLCIFFKQTGKYKYQDFEKWLKTYYTDSLQKALQIKYKNAEKQSSSFNKFISDYNPSLDIQNMLQTLSYSNTNTTKDEYMKVLFSIYQQHLTEKLDISELYTIFHNYCNCNWDTFVKKINNSILLYKQLLFLFIQSSLSKVDQDLINKDDNDEIITIESESSSDSDSDNEDDMIDEWTNNLNTINLKEFVHSEPENNELETLQQQVQQQFYTEKQVNPIIKHIYQSLLQTENTEELIDLLDEIIPENEENIDENLIQTILTTRKENQSNNANRVELYKQIGKLTDKPVFIN